MIINDAPIFRLDHMPYGGVKASGLGREGVRYAMEELTELRLLALKGLAGTSSWGPAAVLGGRQSRRPGHGVSSPGRYQAFICPKPDSS